MNKRLSIHVLLSWGICGLFFIAYTTLSLVRHQHFGSFGFDLGISDQIVWKYSQFKAPITTLLAYAYTSAITDHFDLIYIVLAPFYWVYSSPITLLVLQSALICLSGLPIYWLAKKKNLHTLLCYAVLFGYLAFYGIQHALWFDVHTNVFGAAFLPWFLYAVDQKKYRLAILPFTLAILSKEDIGILTGFISVVFVITRRNRAALLFAAVSFLYVAAVLFVYFPYATPDGYRYAGEDGLLGQLSVTSLWNSPDKRAVYWYTFGAFGFLPLLAPVYILPLLGDLAKFFVFAENLPATHGLYMHYRVTLAVLSVWPTIIVLSRIRILNNRLIALYIVTCTAIVQYTLHLPLSYLTKQWFWTAPASSQSIRTMFASIPSDAPIAVQNNLLPHLSRRDEIFTLWYTKREFKDANVCGQPVCDWLRWSGNPAYVLVDTSSEWDIRHYLADRQAFVSALQNLETTGVLELYKQEKTTVLYKVADK